jgi:hypothetical protein
MDKKAIILAALKLCQNAKDITLNESNDKILF